MHLKENLIEHFDFEAITPSVWKYLYAWYSSDWCILRYVRADSSNTHGVIIDLYPELRNIHVEKEREY
jgi:hypothetical protein